MTAPDPRVGEIEARLSAATPGPWEVEAMDAGHSRYEMNVWITAGAGDTVCDMDGLNRSHNEAVATDDGYADAEFIANAPADVAYLLVELRKAHEALAAVESVHYEGIAYADDVAEGRDEPVPDDYEHHFCQEDGEDWPCTTMAAVAAANGDGR